MFLKHAKLIILNLLQNSILNKISFIFANYLYIYIDMESENKLNIELSNEIAQGSYSNLAIVAHSPNEFIIDFIRVLPGMPKAQVGNRIIMTPANVKRLVQVLKDNVNKFEMEFGEIELNEPINNMPMGFGTPKANA